MPNGVGLDDENLMSDSDSTRTPRYPFTRSGAPAEPVARKPANDPLAELARLIGQHDPFVDPVPEARRRDLHDILAGRRKDDWPGTQEPPLASAFETPPSYADGQHRFAPNLATYETWHAEDTYDHQVPAFDAHTEYGQEPSETPLYGDNGQLVPSDEPSDQPPAGYDVMAPDTGAVARKGRKGLFAVIAVFGLAVIGTAGAYAYRTLISGIAPGAPPLIRADSSPNKVAAASSGDTAGKQIYDRVGTDRPQNERVVSREEQPVDVRPAQPRSSFPATTSQGGVASGPSATPGQASPNGWPLPPGATPASPVPPGVAASATEPRRIRTIPIRSDQLATVPPSESPAAMPVPPPSVPARSQQQPVRQATVSPSPPPAAANAPLSLNPQAAPRAQKQARTSAPVAEHAPTGAYVVQIAANKTEGEASAAFRSAKARYPDVLGDRKLLIRKKEIAGKGTFYGAQVGPFASREDAVQLCENLKSAGGSCIVQRN